MKKPEKCSICLTPCNVVRVTAKLTGIKKDICPRCYLKLRDTGLIEKEIENEINDLAEQYGKEDTI